MKTNRFTETQILVILRQAEGSVATAGLYCELGMNDAPLYK